MVADRGADSRPLFSPQGDKLAFVSDAAGDGDIYTLDIASNKLSRVTYADGRDELSGWSHDGQWIYFGSARDNAGGFNGVYRVSAAGGAPMPVSLETYRNGEQGMPSPDNATIALVGQGLGAWQWWRHGSAHRPRRDLAAEERRHARVHTVDAGRRTRRLADVGAGWPIAVLRK